MSIKLIGAEAIQINVLTSDFSYRVFFFFLVK